MVSKKQLREIIKELRINQKEAEEKLERAQQKINEVKEGTVELKEEINRLKAYIAELEEERRNLEEKVDDAQTDIDKAKELLKINAEQMDVLDEKIEKARVNDHGIEINNYKNKIAKCKGLIEKGINVEINKGLIENYEAQIRYQQNQKESRIMNELDATNKRNGAKNRVIKNEAELAKRKEWSKMTTELFRVD